MEQYQDTYPNVAWLERFSFGWTPKSDGLPRSEIDVKSFWEVLAACTPADRDWRHQ